MPVCVLHTRGNRPNCHQADDVTFPSAPTDTATEESSSGAAELFEGYDHKEHKEQHDKKDEECDDHYKKHDHAVSAITVSATVADYNDYSNDNDFCCGYGGLLRVRSALELRPQRLLQIIGYCSHTISRRVQRRKFEFFNEVHVK
ncbi:hypothetical protein PC128_g23022 [Phytophthora cactorum]|nr:hypothetical protein PC128_g23022 [Phytophthora cactorum]